MSNLGQAITDVVAIAAAIIVAVYVPGGAAYAPAILAAGGLIGSIAFPTKQPGVTGPRLTDHQTTTATLGDPLPICWGTVALNGVVCFLDAVVEHSQTSTVGGKGSSQTITNYTYTQSIGIALCVGPIVDILRIWENGQLVYDKRPIQTGESADDYSKRVTQTNAYATAGYVVYKGTETQDPDPTITLMYGTGQTPPWPGMAYVVYPNRTLRVDQALHHPTFKFEVVATATTELTIAAPTWLPSVPDDFNGRSFNQLNFAVDWPHDRFFLIGGGVGNDNPERLEAWTLSTNTEYAEVPLPPEDNLVTGVIADPYTGIVYVDNGGTYIAYDPVTLEVKGSMTVDSTYLTTVQWAFAQTSDYTGVNVNVLAMIGTFEDTVAVCDVGTLTYVAAESLSFPGYKIRLSLGTTESSGKVPVWWISQYLPTFSGTSTGIRWVKLAYTPAPSIITAGVFTNAGIAITAPGDLVPGWTFLSSVDGNRLDASDGCVIFEAIGGNATVSNDIYIVKVDPTTGAVKWRLDINTVNVGLPNNASNDSVITDNQLYLNTTTGYIIIDTANGTYTSYDLAAQLVAKGIEGMGGSSASTSVQGGMIALASSGPAVIFADRVNKGLTPISQIVHDICIRSTLTEDEIDISKMDSTGVWGYALQSATVNGRDAIQPMQGVGFFDCVQGGETLKFVTRGGAPVVTLSQSDLGAFESDSTDDPDPNVAVTGMLESDLPMQMRLKYISYEHTYQDGEQLSLPRYDTDATQIVDVSLAVVLNDDQAAQIIEINWNQSWQRYKTYTAALDMSKSFLEPTDPVLLQVKDTLVRAMVVKIDDSSQILRKVTFCSDDDGIYVSTAVASPAPPQTTMIFYADSTLQLLDIPLLRDQDDTNRVSAPIYTAVAPTSNDKWSGAQIQISNDGTTFALLGSSNGRAAMGTATTALADARSAVPDETNTLTITFDDGAAIPTSISDDDMDNGLNAAALINADGTVELLQFRDVTPIGGVANTIMVSHFYRGRRGTETMTGGHDVGNRVVMLSPLTIQVVDTDLTTLDKPEYWKAGSLNTAGTASSVQAFTDLGRSLMPWAPCNIHAVLGTGGTPDILVNAVRRARIGASQWVDGETNNLPLAEDFEEYEMDVYNGSAVARTIQSTSLPVTYAHADIITDFGSIPSTLTVALYQISHQVGRGFASIQTIDVEH
jgi:hypothetical protein